MLAAEHYALESLAVQKMLTIRERELNYIDTRMNAMGTQASLIAGFAIGNFVSNFLGPGATGHGHTIGADNEATPPFWLWMFYVTTALSTGSAFHCVLTTTFLSIWGPGLALRGGTGSVSKAYKEMKRERNHIVFSFNFCIITFALQCIATFYTYTTTCSDSLPCWRNSGTSTTPMWVKITTGNFLNDDVNGWWLPNVATIIMIIGCIITGRYIWSS